MRPAPTKTLISRLKREAKARVKNEGIQHSVALEQGAKAAGYSSWHALQQQVVDAAARLTDALLTSLAIDPPLPRRFDQTPNDRRSKAQLDAWWDKPFALSRTDGKLQVRCLDGGAWDRSTSYGLADNAQEALNLARVKLAERRQARQRPFPYIREDGRLDLVRHQQRPDLDEEVVLEGTTEEAIRAWFAEHYGDDNRAG